MISLQHFLKVTEDTVKPAGFPSAWGAFFPAALAVLTGNLEKDHLKLQTMLCDFFSCGASHWGIISIVWDSVGGSLLSLPHDRLTLTTADESLVNSEPPSFSFSRAGCHPGESTRRLIVCMRQSHALREKDDQHRWPSILYLHPISGF
jgi:hypothetical protein